MATGRQTPQNKAPAASTKAAPNTDAIVQALMTADPSITQAQALAQAQSFLSTIPTSAAATALQQSDAFLKSLQANPAELSRWQNAMTQYKNSLDQTANYTPGYVDDTLKADTQALYSMIANNPQASQDPYQALAAATQGAKDASRVPSLLRIPPKFQPLDDASVDTGMQAAFHKALGRDPTPQELSSFSQQYKNLEMQNYAQQAAAVANIHGGGTVTNLSSPEDVAFQQANTSPEAIGYRASQVVNTIRDMIKSG